MSDNISLTPGTIVQNSHSMRIPLRRKILLLFWRQINLGYWKLKLGCIIATSLFITALYVGLFYTCPEMSDIAPKRTAFLDRPCDNALFKACHLGSIDATLCFG